jgi:GNAT superfamily N-acetyltransferase
MSNDTVVSAAAFKPRLATIADIPDICSLYFAAFSGSYILENCFPPSSPAVRDFVTASRKEDLEDPKHITFVIPDENGKVIASATWERPHPAGTPPSESKVDYSAVPFPKDGNPELAAAFFGGMHRKNREIMGDRRHWHLHLIMVLPEYQGRGLATPLMKWGFERAKEENLPIYLDATPKGKGIYERFGFKVVDTLEFGNGALTEYMMVKE